MKTVEIKEMVRYGGHSVKANGAVDITFSAMYSELVNSIKALQLLNNDVTVAAKVGNNKPFKIGSFRIKNVIIDGDGESKIKLMSITDSVEMNMLSDIVVADEFIIKMMATIEEEEDNE